MRTRTIGDNDPMQPDAKNTVQVPHISAITLRFFTFIVRRYFRRHFRSVMTQHAERLAALEGPAIVFANHSSWWDPMVSVLLAQSVLPGRKHYAPMDAAALARYPILRKVGIFPVEMSTTRGAANFLRTSSAILKSGGVLWLTPQARFADPRSEQLDFKPGLAALALREPQATLLPMAIEYTFWDERLPETLMRFGEPLHVGEGRATDALTTQLEQALATTMGTLREASIKRDATQFEAVLKGARGTGGLYGSNRRIRALLTRRNFDEDHTRRP